MTVSERRPGNLMKKISSALCAMAFVALAGPASADDTKDWSKKAADDTADAAKKAVK